MERSTLGDVKTAGTYRALYHLRSAPAANRWLQCMHAGDSGKAALHRNMRGMAHTRCIALDEPQQSKRCYCFVALQREIASNPLETPTLRSSSPRLPRQTQP